MCYYDYLARKKQEQVWKYTKADTDECVRLPKVPADSVPDWEHEHANQDELKALTPQSLDEFHAFCCARWNIEVPEEERRLL